MLISVLKSGLLTMDNVPPHPYLRLSLFTSSALCNHTVQACSCCEWSHSPCKLPKICDIGMKGMQRDAWRATHCKLLLQRALLLLQSRRMRCL